MRRYFLPALLLAGLAVTLAPAARADDEEEPTFGNKKLSYWLEQVSDGKDVTARLRGLIALEQIGHVSRKVVPALVKAMREDKEEKVRARAARATGQVISKAFKEARDLKKEELPRYDNARDDLVAVLRTDKSDAVKEAAAIAIGDVGSDFRGAVSALGLALKEKNKATVTAAATALRRMGRDAREAEPDLVAVVGDKDAELTARVESVVALGQFRADVSAALPTLRAALTDPKIEEPVNKTDSNQERARKLTLRLRALRFRKAIVETLGKWGKESADASATLAAVVLEKEPATEVSDKESKKLVADLQQEAVNLRLAALTSISQIGEAAKGAIPALIKAVNDEDRLVRCLAMQVIVKMGEVLEGNRKPAVEVILKATEDSIIEVSITAVESLGVLSTVGGLADYKANVLKRLDEIEKRDGRKVMLEAVARARANIEGKKEKEKQKDK